MRILYLNPFGGLGGAEVSLLDILRTLREANPTWQLGLIAGGDGPLIGRAETLGVFVKLLPLPASIATLGDSGQAQFQMKRTRLRFLGKCFRAACHSISYIGQLRAAVREFAPDVIHTNGFKMHVLGVWARGSSASVLWHVRDYVSSRPVMRGLLRLHARFCSVAIANSDSVRRDVQTACGSTLKTVCIYNVVDLTKYSPTGETADLDTLCVMAKPEPGTVRIGLVATLARWKGHITFLKALASLPSHLLYRAYVIGGPIYQTQDSQFTLDELRQTAAELCLADKVGFTGFISDSAGAIRALDIVVHASTVPEPFGRVIVEAMACGKPVIVSGAGGARELITEGHDALSHSPGDHVNLGLRIAELAANPALRVRIGRAGRQTAEIRFGQHRLAGQLSALYQQAVGSTGAL